RAIDLDRHAGNRATDAAHLAMAGIVRGGDRAGLGEAIALVDRDAERVDERRPPGVERGAAADRVLEPPAEALADRGEDEAIGERQQDAVERTGRLALRLPLRHLDAVLE